MKHKKLTVLIMIILVLIISAGCSRQEEIEEEPYVKYIITTYSGGKVIDIFEVYSDMVIDGDKHAVKVYDGQNEQITLFYSTLEYTVEEYNKY